MSARSFSYVFAAMVGYFILLVLICIVNYWTWFSLVAGVGLGAAWAMARHLAQIARARGE